MSKFQAGDKVRVIGVTDLDGDYGPVGAFITDPNHEATFDWQSPPQTLIGQVGEVVESWLNDYYDVSVVFPWNAEGETLSMKESDLEKVDVIDEYVAKLEGMTQIELMDELEMCVRMNQYGSHDNQKSLVRAELGQRCSR